MGRRDFFASAFLFVAELFGRSGAGRIDFCGDVEAEDAEVVSGFAGFGERGVEEFGLVGFDFENELIGPGLTVNRAAFDLAEIDVVARERLERGE